MGLDEGDEATLPSVAERGTGEVTGSALPTPAPASSFPFGSSAIDLSHRVSFWRGIVYCQHCGCYAAAKPAKLGQLCPGAPTAGGKLRLSRLRRGMGPTDETWPDGPEAIPPSGVPRRNPAAGAGGEALQPEHARNPQLAAQRASAPSTSRRKTAW